MVSLALFGVRRRFGMVSGTFSCGFEEIGHSIFWDSILIMIGFLVFEYEVLYLVMFIDYGLVIVAALVLLVMIVELMNKRFAY